MTGLIDGLIGLLARVPLALVALVGRLSLGLTFWTSARAKVDGWNLLHASGRNPFLSRADYRIPHVPPEIAAIVVQIAEHAFAAMLVIGLATRFSALGLLVLILVLQIFIHPNAYVQHGTWAAVLLMLIKYGPGTFSVDHLIYRR